MEKSLGDRREKGDHFDQGATSPLLSPDWKVLEEGLGPCTYMTSLQISPCEHVLPPQP